MLTDDAKRPMHLYSIAYFTQKVKLNPAKNDVLRIFLYIPSVT